MLKVEALIATKIPEPTTMANNCQQIGPTSSNLFYSIAVITKPMYSGTTKSAAEPIIKYIIPKVNDNHSAVAYFMMALKAASYSFFKSLALFAFLTSFSG